MTGELQEHGGRNVIALQGEVDLERAPGVRRLLLGCVDQGRDMLVDLSAVSYIDSSGIANLIEALQSAKTNGLRFALVSVSEQAKRVLKLARLDTVFVIYDDLDSALQRS